MEPWQERVVYEADELREKITRLIGALCVEREMDELHFGYLVTQLDHMMLYYLTLCRRIRLFRSAPTHEGA